MVRSAYNAKEAVARSLKFHTQSDTKHLPRSQLSLVGNDGNRLQASLVIPAAPHVRSHLTPLNLSPSARRIDPASAGYPAKDVPQLRETAGIPNAGNLQVPANQQNTTCVHDYKFNYGL
ncbi:hypothetical protein SKAU_G00147530 [Synaphobranchus kaupii]|uniref:Uncharacterized protein n=1 Tax=Synaphobranchus kaupii TaxID=118154 RepID=A0A9Q1FUI6_SYNKA|nr:hypothetical protein SKAU_G00147530 [Synaphobranchus kaupii]